MVNAYLLRGGDRFVLVDTLTVNKRSLLVGALAEAGCTADNLALIVATHGDPDHIGNAAYLHRVFGAPIAAHRTAPHRGDRVSPRGTLERLHQRAHGGQ